MKKFWMICGITWVVILLLTLFLADINGTLPVRAENWVIGSLLGLTICSEIEKVNNKKK